VHKDFLKFSLFGQNIKGDATCGAGIRDEELEKCKKVLGWKTDLLTPWSRVLLE
jgi:hypothetical protein